MLTLLLGPFALFAQDASKNLSPAPPAASSDAQPQPDAAGVYKLGSKVAPPQVIFYVEATFSEKAKRKKLGGICNVGLIVDSQGSPQNVHVVKSVAEGLPDDERSAAISLDKKAVEAVKNIGSSLRGSRASLYPLRWTSRSGSASTDLH